MSNKIKHNQTNFDRVHAFRFKWKNLMVDSPKNVRNILLKINKNMVNFFFTIFEQNENILTLKEIVNINILNKIKNLSNNFKVIGAKGRSVIIGQIDLKEFEIPDKLLILSSLSDWRSYLKLNTIK